MEEKIKLMDTQMVNQEIDDLLDEMISVETGEEAEEILDEVKENEETEATEETIKPAKYPEAVIEAVLFTLGHSVDIKKLSMAVGMNVEETRKIVRTMMKRYEKNDRGIKIIELEDAYQMCTKDSVFENLMRVATAPKNYTLTDTLLETLSIVAYKQPVTRLEIEKIRGVSCDHAVNKLIEYNLIMELGRLDAPGRPLLFGTTEDFLRAFGVTSLDELPILKQERFEDFKKEAEEEIQLKLDI